MNNNYKNSDNVDCSLQKNIHLGFGSPRNVSVNSNATVNLVKGTYSYYHYGCDEFDDRGWGCGYRTLQTMCSWLRFNKNPDVQVPSLLKIQEILAEIDSNSKTTDFIGSKYWIGSIEAFMCIEYLYDVSCKIVHIKQGHDLKKFLPVIINHFQKSGCPIMMGGDSDSASKGILGVYQNESEAYLLILDPHYYGKKPSQETLIETNYLRWQSLDSFMANSFYNLCLVQYNI